MVECGENWLPQKDALALDAQHMLQVKSPQFVGLAGRSGVELKFGRFARVRQLIE